MNSAGISCEIRRKWKPRKKKSHKGDFGRVFILAGSEGYTGAAYLAASAALFTGAGLITLGVPQKVYAILARRLAEVMTLPFPSTPSGSFSLRALKPALNFLQNQSVLALGPGLSRNFETQKFAAALVLKNTRPLVLDADGLCAFNNRPELLRKIKAAAIITPHTGEFERLFGLKVSLSDSDRKQKALWAAKTFGIYVVLKGARTVVAAPDGKFFLNSTGNPGLAKGGSGDVLTGMIAALLGQKFSPWDACRFAVYLHGLSADLAVKKTGEASLTARDLIRFLPGAILKIRRI